MHALNNSFWFSGEICIIFRAKFARTLVKFALFSGKIYNECKTSNQQFQHNISLKQVIYDKNGQP